MAAPRDLTIDQGTDWTKTAIYYPSIPGVQVVPQPLQGTGAPASSLGNTGDFYIDTNTNQLYGPKVSGAWPAPISPQDVTNYKARMEVRKLITDAVPILACYSAGLTSPAGIPAGTMTLGGALGTVMFGSSAAISAALPAGQWVYDVEIISGAGTITRLLQGAFTVSPEVTRD